MRPCGVSAVAAVAAGFVGLSGATNLPDLGLHREFEHFEQEFGKRYSNAKERAKRFATYVANHALVRQRNSESLPYQLALNAFADLSFEEFLTLHAGPQVEARPEPGLRLGTHQPRNVTLPPSVDWRARGAVTAPKTQGACSSCWAFSTTGAIEGAWQIASGNLVSLSEQQLVDCSDSFGNKGCGGGSMDSAFEYVQNAALCTEESYPYEAKNSECRVQNCTLAVPHGAVVGFKDVHPGDTAALMDAVAQQPVSVNIQAMTQDFQFYKSGVFPGHCGTRVDHGVVAVGYGSTEDGQDFWWLKNSWGPTWGMDGFAMIKRGVAGVGECGIKTWPSYPVVTVPTSIEGATKPQLLITV